MLRMKPACEHCNTPLGLGSRAFICSYECTFCPECTEEMHYVCPNCQGELVVRPTRRTSPTAAPRPGFKAKLEKLLP